MTNTLSTDLGGASKADAATANDFSAQLTRIDAAKSAQPSSSRASNVHALRKAVGTHSLGVWRVVEGLGDDSAVDPAIFHAPASTSQHGQLI